MRVLTVGNLYPPHHFGGYEQVWHSAVAHLRMQGHDVQVLATGYRHDGVADGDEAQVDRTLGWYWQDHEFTRIPLRDRLPLERGNHAVLSRHLSALRPDVVSFWSMGGMSHSLIESVRRRGLPIVSFVHDQWLDYGRFTDQWSRLFYAPRRRALARIVDRVTGLPTRIEYGLAGRYVFVSDFVRRKALALPLGLREAAVAHSGIATAFLDHPRIERPWRWSLLYVGRLHPDKGIHDAAIALKHLPQQAHLTFAGSWDPREEGSLATLIKDLGIETRVTLLGQRTPHDIAAQYRKHDALLFPVRWDEPWGLVPLEAMASGCPVIATGRGGSGEYLDDGENCLLVPSSNPPALAAAVERLSRDGGLRERLVQGGLKTAPVHTDAAFNAQVEQHLRVAASRYSPSAEVLGV